MRVAPAILAIVGISVAGEAGLVAQTTDDLVTRAMRAYGEVELDAAVGYLRRWFASDTATRAPLDQRRLALTYLGAAETLRGNPDSAASAFERLVELDPRARIDELTFPPEVTTRFNAVRARTKVVSIDVPPVTEIRPEGERFAAWLFASSPHELRVVLRRPEGSAVRVIYTGLIGDSLAIRWDGRDSSGAWLGSGRYFLEAFSASNGRGPQRVLQVPLEVAVAAGDTLPALPPLPDSLLLPERRSAGAGVEALLGGLISGLGVAVLPPLLMPDADAKPLRFAIAGSIGLAGLVGFLRDVPGGTVEANRRANEERRRNWQARAVARAEENRTRQASIVIRAGQPVVVRLAAP